MADLNELEQRMTAALARISATIDLLPAQKIARADQSALIADLQAQLDLERLTLRQSVPSLPSGEDQNTAAEATGLQARLDEADLENRRLHAAVSGLRQDLRLMEEQADSHLAQAHQATATLQADLDALIQARENETAEIAKILAALAPLIDAEEAHPNAGS
jgi:hypothetical protein